MPTKTPNSSHVVYYDDLEQGSETWKMLRENQFTGSNAYKLLTSFGAGTWAMANDTGFTGNFYTRRGHLLEDQAIELYERIKGVTVGHTGFVTNAKYPNCLYSPDGFLPDRTIEVKAFSVNKHLQAIKNPSIAIKAQCHFGQLILEKKLTDLILFNPSKELPPEQRLVIITIKHDKDIQNNFKRIIREYHENRRG